MHEKLTITLLTFVGDLHFIGNKDVQMLIFVYKATAALG